MGAQCGRFPPEAPEGSGSVDVREEGVLPGAVTALPRRCCRARGPAEPPGLLQVFVLRLIGKTGSCSPLAGPGAELWGWGWRPLSPSSLPRRGSEAAVLAAELPSAVFSAADTSTATCLNKGFAGTSEAERVSVALSVSVSSFLSVIALLGVENRKRSLFQTALPVGQ